jgi:hypothetical protein
LGLWNFDGMFPRQMKNLFPIGVSAWIGLVGLSETSNAGLLNGSFESWTLLGWNVEIPHGISASAPFDRPAGSARTVASWGEDFGLAQARIPQAGYRFAELHTRPNANFIGDETYDLSLSQNLQLNQGEQLSGWSFFFSGDLVPQDSAWVRIFDPAGGQIANPWLEGAGAPHQTSLTATDWTQWQWEAPVTGLYTIRLGMTTSGNNNGASYGFFDGISVLAPNPVPEPGSLALVGVGAMLFASFRRKKS